MKGIRPSEAPLPGPSTRIIELGVLSLFLSLLFARGTFREAIGLLTVGVVLKAIGAERPLHLPLSLRWTLGLLALFWSAGLLVNHGHFWESGHPLLWMGLILIGSFQMPARLFSRMAWRDLLLPLLVLFVVANGIADYFYKGTIYIGKGRPGLFSNIHYLSEYVALTAPALVLGVIRGRGWLRMLALGALLGDLILLVVSKSRPGFLAVVASAVILVPLVAPMARFWIISSMGLILGTLYFGDIGQFSERMDDLFLNLREDERAEIWMIVFEMFVTNTQAQWLFGHGLGQFLMDFHGLGVQQQFRLYVAPHNFLLEILYSHGLIGLLAFLGAVLALYFFLIRAMRPWTGGSARLEGYVLVSTLTASLAHGVFTIPFFSRDFLLPFGFVVSLVLLYVERGRKASSPGV